MVRVKESHMMIEAERIRVVKIEGREKEGDKMMETETVMMPLLAGGKECG